MSPDFERNTLFVGEVEHLLNCIESGTEPCVNLSDGIAAQKIVFCSKRVKQKRKRDPYCIVFGVWLH